MSKAPNDHAQQGQDGPYDHQAYAGDQASAYATAMRATPLPMVSALVDPTSMQRSIAEGQASELASEVRIGDDRAITSTPNWAGMDSEALYRAATANNNPSTADVLGRSFNEGGNRLADSANRLLGAVDKLRSAWTGNSAETAQQALTLVARSAGQAGATAQYMGTAMAQQAAIAEEVRKLPQPVEFDKGAAMREAMASPDPAAALADLQVKEEQAESVRREQISYLTAYTNSMRQIDARTPSFVPPTEPGIDGGGGGGAPNTGGRVSYPGGGGGGDDQSTAPGTPHPGYVGVAPGAGGAEAGLSGDESTGESGPIAPLPGFTPGTGTAGYTPTAGPAPVTGVPATPGLAPGGAPAAGAGGFGNAFGAFGPTGVPPAGASGSGAASGGSPSSGSGSGQAGARGGGVTPTGSAAAGSTAAGARGAGGMAPGSGRSRKEDDSEHGRAEYLVEGDPDSVFGSDKATAPPVIGQD